MRAPSGTRAGRELVSRDGTSALILGYLTHTDEGDVEDAAKRIPPAIRSDTLDVTVGGFAIGFNDVNDTIRDDLERAELIAFPILAILLLLVFRGLVAASLPLLIGGIAVVGTFLSLRVLSEFTEISIFALNITTALGLGLAVDYGLLLVSRYREELARAGPGLGGAQPHGGDRGAHDLLQRTDGGRRRGRDDRAAAALPVFDGRGSRDRGAARGGGRALRDARDARPARRARERPQPAPLGGATGGQRALVPSRPDGHAAARPGRGRGHRRAPGPRLSAGRRDAGPAGQPGGAGGPRRAHGDGRR